MSVTNFRRASLKNGLPKSSEFGDIAPTPAVEPVLTSLLYLLDASNGTSWPGSGSNWIDISGQGNNLQMVNGLTYSTAGGAPSMYFDGINDYGTFGAGGVPQPSLPITFNFWLKGSEVYPNQPDGMFDSSPGSANVLRQINGIAYGGVVNYPTVEWSGQNPFISLTEASGSYTVTNWNQYTFVYNYATNRSVKWYMNGVLKGTATGNTTSTLSWNELVIGAINKNDFWLNGYMNNTALYSVELSAAQILQNYDAYRGRFGL
jgi:hypothetical protein